MPEQDPFPKFTDTFAFRCYGEELARWNKLFKTRNCSLGNKIRELLNRESVLRKGYANLSPEKWTEAEKNDFRKTANEIFEKDLTERYAAHLRAREAKETKAAEKEENKSK